MEFILKLISNCFETEMYSDETKREIKKKLMHLKRDDINYLQKCTFDLYRKYQISGSNMLLTDCLEKIVNTFNSVKNTEIEVVTGVYFSAVDDCTEKLIEFIKSSKEVLLICVFTISDDRISQHIAAQHRKGVKVKIITDNEKQFDAGSDVMRLSESGIEVRIDKTVNHMHHKFAISDHKSILTGSYNWTRSASEFNDENFIILSDEFAINRYRAEFERLWKTSVDI